MTKYSDSSFRRQLSMLQSEPAGKRFIGDDCKLKAVLGLALYLFAMTHCTYGRCQGLAFTITYHLVVGSWVRR